MRQRIKHRTGRLLIVVCAAFFAAIGVGNAQQPAAPQIPDHTFLITDFGAVGDGKMLNTEAIQHALNQAAENGGTVIVPKGIFLCGPLTMQGKTNLVIQKGAVLRLSNDVATFPAENERYLNFVTIKKASDVKISGEGTIDGQGQIWWDKFTAKELTFRRPQMLFAERCGRLELVGVTFLNPPNTHVSLKDCSEVYIHDITIQAPQQSRNTDGLNISVKNCLIECCTINTGDDNIAINFGNKNNIPGEPECENITIRNCTFGYGHGLSVGSYTSGGLRNLNVHDCTFDGTTSAIRIKTARGRGGLVEDVSYSDITIDHSKWPVFISEYYPAEPAVAGEDAAQPVSATTPHYRNITLKNITITNAMQAVKIWGIPESPIESLKFINVKVDAKKGLQVYNVKGISFENSVFNIGEGERISTFNADIIGL